MGVIVVDHDHHLLETKCPNVTGPTSVMRFSEHLRVNGTRVSRVALQSQRIVLM